MSDRTTSPAVGNGNQSALVCLARAYAGAILFSFPILMTMEMWSLGASVGGYRLALLTILAIPLIVGLSYYDGFEHTSSLRDDVIDAFVAYTVGFSASALLLFLFNVINPSMSADEIIGKVALQAVPASIGAILVRAILNVGDQEDAEGMRQRSATYVGQLFLMIGGAIFLSMSVAPTEEMILISFTMTVWQTVGLMVLSLALMQGFIYAVEYTGHSNALSPDSPLWSVFLRYTVVGYAMVLLVSFYVLWTFGSLDGMGSVEQLEAVVVLSLPGAVGAGASRLIL